MLVQISTCWNDTLNVELCFTYVVGLGDNWGPLIINSEEEYNTSVQTMEYEVDRSRCTGPAAFIGGSIARFSIINYYEDPERYLPNESGIS